MKSKWIYLLSLLLLLASCAQDKNEVVIYCALDKMYSEPILKDFEKQSGIKIKVVYDTELTKTVGLVNRILAEASNPQCDVFWNNEISRTILLQEKNQLQPYPSPSAFDIPSKYKDSLGYWAGFAARARIIIYNKSKCNPNDLPSSMMDLSKEKWKGKAAIAYPLFGTTATHAATLFSEYGNDWAMDFFEAVKENEVGILDGNATVRDRVVSGDYWWGFTDTDDANGAIEDGKNVGIIYPDQKDDEMGMLIIPNTIALIKDGPNQENGKLLIDFVLKPKTEEILARARSAQIPLRPMPNIPKNVMNLDSVKQMDVDFYRVCGQLNESSRKLGKIFIK